MLIKRETSDEELDQLIRTKKKIKPSEISNMEGVVTEGVSQLAARE